MLFIFAFISFLGCLGLIYSDETLLEKAKRVHTPGQILTFWQIHKDKIDTSDGTSAMEYLKEKFGSSSEYHNWYSENSFNNADVGDISDVDHPLNLKNLLKHDTVAVYSLVHIWRALYRLREKLEGHAVNAISIFQRIGKVDPDVDMEPSQVTSEDQESIRETGQGMIIIDGNISKTLDILHSSIVYLIMHPSLQWWFNNYLGYDIMALVLFNIRTCFQMKGSKFHYTRGFDMLGYRLEMILRISGSGELKKKMNFLIMQSWESLINMKTKQYKDHDHWIGKVDEKVFLEQVYMLCKTLNDLIRWFNIESEYKFQKDSKITAGQIKRATEITMEALRSNHKSIDDIKQSIRIESG